MESKHYGEIIQKIRQDRNMSLKEAAGDAITPNNLSRFEKGLSTVKVDTFFYLLDKLNVEVSDIDELLKTPEENFHKVNNIFLALDNKDFLKAREILGGKKDWHNPLDYYIMLLLIVKSKTIELSTPNELEAVDNLMNYISRLETFYSYDFYILDILFNIRNLSFEKKFLEYLEKIISNNLENSKSKSPYFSVVHISPLISLIKVYSRCGYYQNAEKLIDKLKLLLTQDHFTRFSLISIFYVNMYEVYNLLRQNNPKSIERAKAVIHYIDAQNDFFPLSFMYNCKNTFIQEVQRLNKTGIPFPMEDVE